VDCDPDRKRVLVTIWIKRFSAIIVLTMANPRLSQALTSLWVSGYQLLIECGTKLIAYCWGLVHGRNWKK